MKDDIQTNVFSPLVRMYPNTANCIEEAKAKGTSVTKNIDTSYAVALINLYTQSCKLNDQTYFYGELNRQLREGANTFWQTVGNIFDRAIDYLNIEFFNVTYRAQSDLDMTPIKGENYTFKSLTSTSLIANMVEYFYCQADSKYFFEMYNVKGLDVSPYSAFAIEEEVLLKSGASFYVSFERDVLIN